jgi:hypothetical protein
MTATTTPTGHPRGRPLGSKDDPNRARLPFKTHDVMRAIRGVTNMGMSVAAVEIDPKTGLITVKTREKALA